MPRLRHGRHPAPAGGRTRPGAGGVAVGLGSAGAGRVRITGVQAVEEQGRRASQDYYQALVERKYGAAYQQLCESAQRRESRRDFERRVADEPQVADYRVGEVDTTTLTVPVDVTYTGGDRDRQQVTLEQDQQTGAMEVCAIS
ncbi:hypothetical protein [Micromonospora sp. NPDC049799]|uniref:hypothetical protein n=1 Tax=Micromonospora sp. NPDC049799 TaxID=3154741 RepID=UPI0033FF580A